MGVIRSLRHLCATGWRLRRDFSSETLDAIEAAINVSEASHNGELRFAIEAALDIEPLLRGLHSRARAIEVFSFLRVWDTAENSGVLIYLLLADRKVEIVADRGIAAKVEQAEWESVCRDMEQAFRAGDFRGGSIAGVQRISALLAQHFPPGIRNPNELPNKPYIF